MIVTGMGRFGQIVVRLLRARRIEVTAIDHDTEQIEAANRFGWRTYYGDARRPDVLAGAGIEEAHLCILAFDDPDGVVATARHIRDNFPRVRLLARSRSRIEAQELTRLGVPTIRELIGSAVEAAELALVEMGEDPAVAADIAERFRRHDEDLVRRMSQVTDREQRLKIYSQGRADFMRVLEAELAEEKAADPRRQDVTEGVAS